RGYDPFSQGRVKNREALHAATDVAPSRRSNCHRLGGNSSDGGWIGSTGGSAWCFGATGYSGYRCQLDRAGSCSNDVDRKVTRECFDSAGGVAPAGGTTQNQPRIADTRFYTARGSGAAGRSSMW